MEDTVLKQSLARLTLGIFVTVACGPALADDAAVAEFYKGKTITMIVPFAPGGISANFGQAVADSIGKYIPGNPTIKAEFMPGGGGATATNYLYNSMPRDGTSLIIVDQAVVTAQYMNPAGVQYDATKINFIGVANDTTNVLMVRKDTGVSKLDDLKTKEVFIASSGIGSETDTFPRLVNGLLGTKMNVVAGFPGGASEVLVAIESGEMHGSANGTSTWAGRPDLVAILNPILVFGNGRTDNFPDTPNLLELVTDPMDQQVVRFLSSGNAIARSVATTPDVPEDRLAALRAAFQETLKDPAFIETMTKLKQRIKPMTGEETQELIKNAMNVSPEVVARAKALLAINK
jgi:tripartite-type tricarboxylate transporter receptor subunit TctC